jgi:hypothetical protein
MTFSATVRPSFVSTAIDGAHAALSDLVLDEVRAEALPR